MRTVHVRISGRVQGVGFRAWARDRGERRGLRGWVRNRRDGGVELVASGPGEEIGAFLEDLRKGPRFSRVDALEVGEADEAALAGQGGQAQFSVLPTA